MLEMQVFSAKKQRNQFELTASFLIAFLVSASACLAAGPDIAHYPRNKLVTISDGTKQLTLRLNYNAGCVVDQINIRGANVAADIGACTGVRIGDKWMTTKTAEGIKVRVGAKTVVVSGIKYGDVGQEVRETWKFTALADRIVWQINRKYSADATLADMAFPEWEFSGPSWTGGLLDNGGVVLSKYLHQANATYGGHFGTVTFWNANSNECLRITPHLAPNLFGAGRFSRQTNGNFSFNFPVSTEPLTTSHGQSRFLENRQDLWEPLEVRPAEITAAFELQALDYNKAYGRGTFVGLDGNNVRELLNTVARYGVIDSRLVGGNGWRSGYICLHEPFFAQIAATVDAADYTTNLAAALDFARDHAISADGRVKSRWCYGPGDAMPGTYDKFGFYEAQWGYLMDSQPDYVMNVVELFDLTGDREWLASHRNACERALAYLTRREVGNTGLVAMTTDYCNQARGSDWIDIIWAAYENAFINAQLYAALNLWAEAEETLGDAGKASNYRSFASRLKSTFNRPTSEGGFWEPTNKWYVYWRNKDGSVHGNNLVTPINFAAIAYGLCDDPGRKKAILDRMEAEMKKENLFYWPLNFFPYEKEEGAGSNFPFPKYENGDIFLSWGELGVRAYAAYDPVLALKYVKNTLARYAADGLSFQRYLRQSQHGAGDDILAGNCMPIVGLYRDIYGIQPKPNRLYLEPHLTGELGGTRLLYRLRGQLYQIDLGTNGAVATVGNYFIGDEHPFGVNTSGAAIQYFHGTNAGWSMSMLSPKATPLAVQVVHWPDAGDAAREWIEFTTSQGGAISHEIHGLMPKASYQLYVDGELSKSVRADATGQIRFQQRLGVAKPQKLEITLAR